MFALICTVGISGGGAKKMVLSGLEDQLGMLEINEEDGENYQEEEATPRLYRTIQDQQLSNQLLQLICILGCFRMWARMRMTKTYSHSASKT